MKNGLKKFGKGMFAIFTIKVVIIGIVLFYQSCTSDSEVFEDTTAKDNFIESIQLTRDNLQNVKVYDKKDLGDIMLKRGVSEPTITEFELIKIDSDDDITADDFGDLVDLIKIGELNIKTPEEECVDRNGTEVCLSVYVDEEQVKESMKPSIQEAKNYLYSKGLSNFEINTLLNETNTTDEYLIPIVMAFATAEENNSSALLNNFNFFAESTYAQEFDVDKAKDCAIAALGLNVFDVIRNVSETGFKKALKAALKGIATRFLGPVGVAITVAEWAWCYSH